MIVPFWRKLQRIDFTTSSLRPDFSQSGKWSLIYDRGWQKWLLQKQHFPGSPTISKSRKFKGKDFSVVFAFQCYCDISKQYDNNL